MSSSQYGVARKKANKKTAIAAIKQVEFLEDVKTMTTRLQKESCLLHKNRQQTKQFKRVATFFNESIYEQEAEKVNEKSSSCSSDSFRSEELFSE